MLEQLGYASLWGNTLPPTSIPPVDRNLKDPIPSEGPPVMSGAMLVGWRANAGGRAPFAKGRTETTQGVPHRRQDFGMVPVFPSVA